MELLFIPCNIQGLILYSPNAFCCFIRYIKGSGRLWFKKKPPLFLRWRLPQEKRAKSITVSDLEKEANQIKRDADGRGITMEESQLSDKLDEHPLYKNDV